MKKIYLTAVVFAALTTSFVSCSNEDLMQGSAPSAVVDGQSGRVVFNVKTGKDVIYTRSVSDAETAVKKMSVLFFDASGSLIPGIKRDYEATDLAEGKLSVSIPSDWMNRTNLTAYVITNVESILFESVTNKEQLLNMLATTATTTESVATNGIPMASAAVDVNTTVAMVSVEATLKRAMSSLYVQVNPVDGATVNAGDFTYTVKNVRKDKGYLFKDEVCEGEVAEAAVWAPVNNSNALELLGYMYQSDAFEIVVTPKATKPELGSASRTVLVAADKAMKRNRKYVLNVTPKVSESGTIDFTVTVQDWDATDGSFNVDWADRFTIATSLPTGIVFRDEQLRATNAFEGMGEITNNGINYGPVKNFFQVSEGVNIVDIKAISLSPGGWGLEIVDGELVARAWKLQTLEDVLGALQITTEKGGVQATQQVPFYIEGALVTPIWGFNYSWQESPIISLYEYAGRLEFKNIQLLEKTTATLPVASVLQVASGYEIEAIAPVSSFESSWDTGRNVDGTLADFQFKVELTSDKRISFKKGGGIEGYGYVNVRLKKTDDNTTVVRKMVVRFRNG